MSGKRWSDIRSVELYVRAAFALVELKINWKLQSDRIRARDYLMEHYGVNKGTAYRLIRVYRDARSI